MKRSEKEAIVAEVADKASRATAMYFANFSGLSVEQETDLRREFRKVGVEYTVAKNTLVKKALEQISGYDGVFDKLVGPTGIAFSYDDVAAPARIIKKFSDKTGKLSLFLRSRCMTVRSWNRSPGCLREKKSSREFWAVCSLRFPESWACSMQYLVIW
jgi:hypothetical protein